MRVFAKILLCICVVLTVLTIFSVPCAQEESPLIKSYNGYQAIIDDQADLLSASEIEELWPYLDTITERGGNAVFISTNESSLTAAQYAKARYIKLCGDTDGVAFLVDMYHREIIIFSNEGFADKITESKANQIADNSYRYATNGDYFECAKNSFIQINRTLQGKFVFSPMKLITSLFLGFAISLLGCIMVVYFQRRQTGKLKDITEGNERLAIEATPTLINVSKTRHVESSGGSGGHSSGGGGRSGGGGGGHSSSGGHRF